MDLKENRDRVGSSSIWLRAIFYNVFIFLAIYICWVKGWVNLLDGIVGFGDLAGLVALLVFTYTSWKEAVMLFYDAWAKRERTIGREEGREEEREKIRQMALEVFADDKDTLERVNRLLEKRKYF